MGRSCDSCGEHKTNSNFSRNQMMKGSDARCKDCVDRGGSGGYVNVPVSYQCQQCSRLFSDSNQLEMHMQTHRERNVACPVCRETRFRSGANAIQHVESGYCTGCTGQDNARQQIYEFAARQGKLRGYMTGTPMLTNGNNGPYGTVPDLPYCCPDCSKSFRQMSQLLQHQDNKHRNYNMLSY